MNSGRAISVLSTLALRGILERYRQQFEQALGARLEFRFGATQAILKELESAARDAWPDLLVLTAEAMQQLQAAGRVSQVEVLGSSGVGVAVRAGARARRSPTSARSRRSSAPSSTQARWRIRRSA